MPHKEFPQPFGTFPKYPHLRPADIRIWQAFIDQNPGRFDRVFYDFRVGDAEESPETVSRQVEMSWHDLTRWQIDVIAEDEKNLYIIEIKPHAGSSAIGQVLCYTMLYKDEQKPEKPVIPVVLTDLIIKTTKRCAEHYKVQMWEV